MYLLNRFAVSETRPIGAMLQGGATRRDTTLTHLPNWQDSNSSPVVLSNGLTPNWSSTLGNACFRQICSARPRT